MWASSMLCFFFFQAEDGIRDYKVTGVQTCALPIFSDRRRRPLGETDLLTRLLQEAELTDSELLQNCVFLLNAGHETTTNLIGNGLCLLLSHPESFERLRCDPQLIGTAVEECLRLECPNQLGNRLVSERVTIRGVALEPNTYLTLCIGAAKRDPGEFPDPGRFDVARRPNRHLAFAAGAHACAGMGVARGAQIALLRAVHRSEEHTSELQSPCNLVCRLLLEINNPLLRAAEPLS